MAPEPVELPDLPPGTPVAVRKVAEFVALAVGLRRGALMDHADELPCAVRWIERWTGVDYQTVPRVMKRLVKLGVLKRGEDMPARGARGTRVYRVLEPAVAEIVPFPQRRREAS